MKPTTRSSSGCTLSTLTVLGVFFLLISGPLAADGGESNAALGVSRQFETGYLQAPRAQLAVVFDDLGYNAALDQRLLAWPHPLTVAVLPRSPHARLVAEEAAFRGKEVILHQPMEPTRDVVRREEGTLTRDMSRKDFEETLRANLAAVPSRVGLNNHTGSQLTADRPAMHRLMQQLAETGLYFLDSRTTPDTVAHQVAEAWGVPVISRDVFLDHVRTPSAVAAEFHRALAIARRDGAAVIIAHPNALSVGYLEAALASLPTDIELVRVSELLGSVR